MRPEVLLYTAEVILIIAAVPAMLWLRSAGDESWRRHQFAQAPAFREIAEAFAQVRAQFVDQMTPALTRAAASLTALFAAITGQQAVTDELVRLTLGGKPDRPELRTDVPGEGAR